MAARCKTNRQAVLHKQLCDLNFSNINELELYSKCSNGNDYYWNKNPFNCYIPFTCISELRGALSKMLSSFSFTINKNNDFEYCQEAIDLIGSNYYSITIKNDECGYFIEAYKYRNNDFMTLFDSSIIYKVDETVKSHIGYALYLFTRLGILLFEQTEDYFYFSEQEQEDEDIYIKKYLEYSKNVYDFISTCDTRPLFNQNEFPELNDIILQLELFVNNKFHLQNYIVDDSCFDGERNIANCHMIMFDLNSNECKNFTSNIDDQLNNFGSNSFAEMFTLRGNVVTNNDFNKLLDFKKLADRYKDFELKIMDNGKCN